jgi:CheY-like chemotaxis protein
MLQQQYCFAQKMEIFGHLAGGVAHDFNNLLTVILGYSEIGVSRLSAGDSTRELFGEIRKAGERAENLTRQLLAFGRKRTTELKVVDLNAVVSDTERMLRRLIGEDVLMTTLFAPQLKPVRADAGQMQQVILNLAVNARDAMPRGGRLTVETANVELDDAYVQTHPHVKPGPYVLFAMTDTGVGMRPEVLARIFEPFFTTKGPGKGTGLGLATVHAIVKQHGGHIDVRSSVGQGAAFQIYLPQVRDAVSAGKSSHHLGAAPRGCETVLLAEDDDSVRHLARHVLELNGYHVLEASNGDDALGLAHGHGGPIHLLVSDVVMPRLGGRPLADHLLTSHPQLKVLFLSGYTSDAILRHGVLDSDCSFLQKPFTTSALAQKVREVLDAPIKTV